jgi:hypothetical protein
MKAALERLAGRHGLRVPALARAPWQETGWNHKRSRIVCEQRDEPAG